MNDKQTMIALDPNKSKVFGTQKKKKSKPTSICKVPGCNNHITEWTGKGSHTLCEEHQKTLREFKGFARLDRPYTLHKKLKCDACGHEPYNNIRLRLEPALERTVYAYRLLQVDHIVPPTNPDDKYILEHECNHPDNLQTLCGDCHQIKTLKSGDFTNNKQK